ncbi:hypothetical protein TNCV_4020681 [Trichonephila clavipes]|nr:hypothetical protein TNCV_4020681 [Trichonephila clavipes]
MGRPLAEKLKALWGEKKLLRDGKTIGGKGRLTGCYYKQIDDFYGNAIRANSHNVNEMRQAVWAVWAHTSSTDDEPKHWFCPKGKIAGATVFSVRLASSIVTRWGTPISIMTFSQSVVADPRPNNR